MWILVVGGPVSQKESDGAQSTLSQLGCRVEVADFWQNMDRPEWIKHPPDVCLIEALDEVDAGRFAFQRIRSVPALTEIPILLALTVGALSRLQPADGFDDFVLYPYVPAELYARIRKIEWRKSSFATQERTKVGSLCLDLAAHEVTVHGRRIELTRQEFSLLRFFCQHQGRVFSRSQLLSKVWDVGARLETRTVDIHVRRLRAKLGSSARLIETVRGAGYKMNTP